MRKLLPFLLLSGCANPLINHHQVDWCTVIYDPPLNCLLDQTPLSSSAISGVYIHYRGIQLRQKLLETHICNYGELITLTNDLVNRGIVSAIDLESIISFQATLQSELYKLDSELEKVLYEFYPMIKTYPNCLRLYLCDPTCLPTPLLDAPCAPCLDLTYYYNDEERVNVLTEAETAARNSFDMTEELFTRGLKSSIDLLTAHKALIAAQEALIQAQVDYLVDYITLYKRY